MHSHLRECTTANLDNKVVFDKNFLFKGKSIRIEQVSVKDKNRAEKTEGKKGVF